MSKFLSSSPIWESFAIAIVRIVLGVFLVYHGLEIFDEAKMNEYLSWDAFKKASSGTFLVYSGKALELIAGVLLIPGLFTRIASLLIIGVMLYISFVLGNGIIWYNDQHPFMFVMFGFLFFFIGSGSFSLDHLLFQKQK
ncbi:MAG: DoxX family protein [Lacibacter sp.]|jgi:putative oxidoreductase|nr:DoxX family protein [Lacibacter sp.]